MVYWEIHGVGFMKHPARNVVYIGVGRMVKKPPATSIGSALPSSSGIGRIVKKPPATSIGSDLPYQTFC